MKTIEIKNIHINERDVPGFGIHKPGQIKKYPQDVAKSLCYQSFFEENKPAKKAEKEAN